MTRRTAVWGLVAIACIWGSTFTVSKLALGYFSPFMLLTVRFTVATLLALAFVRRISRREVKAGLLLGLLFWGGFVFQINGLPHTTPGRSAFITGLSTPLVPLVMFAVYRVVPRLGMVLGIVAAGLGLWLLTNPNGGGLNHGDALTLGCAGLFACQIVAAGHFSKHYAASRLLVVQLAVTAVLSPIAGPLVETPRLDFTVGATLAIAFLSLTAVTTFWFQLKAQRLVSPASTGLIFAIEPVAAVLVSYLVFGETLTPAQWGGAALILAGTLLSELWPARRPAVAAAAHHFHE